MLLVSIADSYREKADKCSAEFGPKWQETDKKRPCCDSDLVRTHAEYVDQDGRRGRLGPYLGRYVRHILHALSVL